jgi:hypothetical protein
MTNATTATTIGIARDDSRQEVAAPQLEDELVFDGGGDFMGGMHYHSWWEKI